MDVRETRVVRERYDDIVDAICTWHEEARASKLFSMPVTTAAHARCVNQQPRSRSR